MTKLGKYEILEEAGRGGFSVVYKARDPDLDQVVALKVLHGAYADRPDVVQRFLNEARKAVKLRQRGIVRIYAVDEEGGVPYIAMEYLPGGTLADRLRGEPLPLDGAITVVGQVAAALDHAHRRQLVHRDVKPTNILFDDEGHAVLVDFGLVKSLAESGLTSEGTSLGTPHYMAPEQAETTTEVDARADVYGLGVVAYEMLTGRVPFEAESPLSVLHAHVHDVPPDPRALNQALDEGIVATVLKALAKAPAERHQSAGVFARALSGAWGTAQEATRAEATLAGLYAQVQGAVKAAQWGAVVSVCVEIRNVDPDYRDVSTLLTLAASHLAEEEQQRQQERELGEQYGAALELLEAGKYAQAVEALEPIAAQAPDFREVGEKLEEARAGMERARLYEAALAKMADECPDQACDDLLALLKRDPDHADARARLLEATEGALAQLRDARAELAKVGSESEALRARVAELEAQLEQAREAVTLYDALAQAVEKRDWERCAEVGERLLQLAPDLDRPQVWLTRARDALERHEAPEEDRIVWERDGKEMVCIPAGVFLYGGTKEEVELPEFWIDKTPVTNAEYARFVAATERKPPEHWEDKVPRKEIADHPVVYVSWHDAVAYAEWAGKRLPTEEEWEKAARGTDGREYPWGNEEPTPQLCNFGRNEGGTTPVGKYSPQGDSPYGCVDMAGNVWEWASSDYDKSRKVLRGGSWAAMRSYARAAGRNAYEPGTSPSHVGLRCVGQPGE